MTRVPHTYETTVNHLSEGRDKEQFVSIETSEPSVITALLKKPESFAIVGEDNTPGCPRLVRFAIPVNDVNWAGLAKRKGSPRPNLHQNAADAFEVQK